MATLDLGARPSGKTERRFYVWMALVLAAVIVAGFSTTVPGDFQAPGIPLLLHLHGAVFTLWVLLFVAQPAFIANGSARLHRQLGWVGVGLASAMVVMGLTATLIALRIGMVPPFFPHPAFLALNTINILTFGGLISGAIALRRRAEWHKRLMLCATASILGPALGRLLPMGAFGPAAPLIMFAAIDLFALAGPAFDLITTRRIHPAYLWGVGVVVLSQAIIIGLAGAPATLALARVIQGG